MQTTYLQSLIATTAVKIMRRESYIRMDIEDAKRYKAEGEIAFSLDSYKLADRGRAKLKRLVAIQTALKTELQTNLRLARIERKIAKLVSVGFTYEKPAEHLSREIEAKLDELVAQFVPKKADSRLAA